MGQRTRLLDSDLFGAGAGARDDHTARFGYCLCDG